MDKNIHQRFHLRDLAELRQAIASMNVDIPLSEDLSRLGDPMPIAGRIAPNRFVAQPMEGFDSLPDGTPGELTFRRYERYARGGFGIIWFEATAVLNEGRSNPGQLCIHRGNAEAYAALVTATRKAAESAGGRPPVLILQLTHSGRYSKPTGIPAPIIAHRNPMLDPLHKLPADYPVVTDSYLDALQDSYLEAARIAARAGFDGVDIKSCHRYLVSELLASFTREGRYGGSFENRTRLLRETAARIVAEVSQVFVTTRMNAYDAMAHPYGFGVNRDDFTKADSAEPAQLAIELARIGMPLLNVSIGNPYFNPHFGRPYDFPIKGMAVPSDHPLAGIGRFIAITESIARAVPGTPVVGSGYSWLRNFLPYVAAGLVNERRAALIGIGRGAFAYPSAVRDILVSGKMDPEKCCVACSACTQIMRDGGKTGCVVRDSEIYGPQYRLARRFSLDRLMDEARRCRDCEYPTCRKGCPACVNVPRFIKAFVNQDIRAAYQVLRESNVLPEMCAYVCPSEVQCEGNCVEKIFCENPVPIRDIQMAVCRTARRQGWTGIQVPDTLSATHVAVVGAGPTGLAATIRLVERGHQVTLFEKDNRLGGTPRSIIPADRYDNSQNEIDAILAPAIQARRLVVRYDACLGRNLDMIQLEANHDAVLLAIGLGRSVSMGRATGVWDALQFLRAAKNGELQKMPARVAVLGAGNTAMDAALTARRLGASDVHLVYRRSFTEMPAWPAERDKTLQAGCHLLLLTQPLGYEVDPIDGVVKGVRIARTELASPDASGRRAPVVLEHTESVLRVDLVVEAMGQIPDPAAIAALQRLGLDRTTLNQSATPDSFQTALAKVYAAGDLRNGGTTAVQGVHEGMRAAEEIHRNLARSTAAS